MEQPAALCGFSLWFIPLGFPRGEAAERSEADEGWRELESSKIPVEWCKTETNTSHPAAFIYQPVAAPHQSRQNIGSEVPIFHRDSFPPGEAKGQLRKLVPLNEQLSCVSCGRLIVFSTVAMQNCGGTH